MTLSLGSQAGLKRLRRALACLTCGLAISRNAVGVRANTIGIPCGPSISAVCAAADIQDPVARTAELTVALSETLESRDPSVREAAYLYLCALTPAFDPRPLQRSLERFDTLDEGDRGIDLVEVAELRYASRETRLETYRRAIAHGSILIGRVHVLPNTVAIELAADEGLNELRDSVKDAYPHLTPGEQALVGTLNFVLIKMDLRAGGIERGDAIDRGAERLAAMPEEEFADHLDKSPDWRRAVGDLALDACEDRGSRGCANVRTAYTRFQTRFADASSVQQKRWMADHPGERPTERSENRELSRWFGNVGEIVGAADVDPPLSQ